MDAVNANLWEGNALKDAFVRLGLTDVAAREFMENGVTDVHQLRSLSSEALARLIKLIQRDRDGGAGLIIPFMSQEYIQAMLFWTHRKHSLGLPYDAVTFNRPDTIYWMEKRREQEEADEAAEDLIKAPEIFKKDTDWHVWSENMLTYTRSKQGKNNAAPLAYILREHNIPTPDMVFPNDFDEKIGRTMLAGPQYAADNATVYDLLKSLAGNGPLLPFIGPHEPTRNGRAAWKALKAYYEGDSMNSRMKNAAYNNLLKANYQGPRRNFEFSTYVTIHQKAHEELSRFGEPVAEMKKVRDFLDGITDPKCDSIKLTVMASPIYRTDFNEMVNYVTGAIDLLSKSKTSSTRQIAEISTNDTGRGGRSGGRGFYRGGSRIGYRGGRGGRGGGRGGGGRHNNVARSYSPQEWQALSAEERARVFQARERNRGGGGRYHQGGRNSQNISSIISHEQEEPLVTNDDVSAITSRTTAETTAGRTVDNC